MKLPGSCSVLACWSMALHVQQLCAYEPLHPFAPPAHAAYTARMVGLAQEWAADEEAPMKLLYVLSHR